MVPVSPNGVFKLLLMLFTCCAVARKDTAVAQCLSGNWSYLGPAAFDHQSDPAWTNEVCLYHWERVGPNRLAFVSPPACSNDYWKKTPATVDIGEQNSVTFRFINDTDHQAVVHTGFVGQDCSMVDMDDGGLFVRSQVHPYFMAPHEWMRVAGAWLIRAAQITFKDETRHLTPGYPTAYNGQWLRDSFYGISLMWDLANTTHHKDFAASAEWMFSRAREDGIMPQACGPDDTNCGYGQGCNDTVGAPDWQGCQDLDSAGFSVKLAHHIWLHLPANEQHAFFRRWSDALERTINATTSDPDGSGLLWSNTSRPMVGYGFQDTVVKSGAVLYSSVLLWNASGLLASMANVHGDVQLAERMDTLAARIKVAADAKLWDEDAGVFRASTGLEHELVDIWGNALVGATGFASARQSRAIHAYFVKNEADIFYEGQVRQVPKPQQWKQVVPFYEQLMYQNGGYWATPLHHVLPFLAMRDRDMACRLLNQTIHSFRGHGIWEWVGPFFPGTTHGAAGYIASAAGTYYASEQLRCWEAEEDQPQDIVHKDVKALLEDLNLHRFGYEHALLREGFESMEALRLATEADLAACDMKVGHRLLVLKRFSKTGWSNTFV